MHRETIGKYLVFGVLAAALLLPGWYLPRFIKQNPPLQTTAPFGFTLAPSPSFHINNWMTGDFQAALGDHLRDDPYVRPFSIKLKNEFHYRVFNRTPHPVLRIGEEGHLFDKTYLRAYLGLNYVGEEAVAKRADEFEEFRKELLARGKELLVLMPPPKALLKPQYIPTAYAAIPPSQTNRDALIEAFANREIPLISFANILDYEQMPHHPVYPKTGLHWSHYGAYWAADTISKRIESLIGKQLPHLKLESIELTNKLRSPDFEFLKLLNLRNPLTADTMAYPVIAYESDSLTYRPNVLIVGDSYYRVLYDMGLHQNLFAPESRYWHYFTHHIAPAHDQGVLIDRSLENVLKAVEEADLVIFEAGATNLHRIGFGFAETYLQVVQP